MIDLEGKNFKKGLPMAEIPLEKPSKRIIEIPDHLPGREALAYTVCRTESEDKDDNTVIIYHGRATILRPFYLHAEFSKILDLTDKQIDTLIDLAFGTKIYSTLLEYIMLMTEHNNQGIKLRIDFFNRPY